MKRLLHLVAKLFWKAAHSYCEMCMIYLNYDMLRAKLSRFSHLLSGSIIDIGCGTKPHRDLFNVDNYIGANAAPYYFPDIDADISGATDVWIDSQLPLPFADRAFDGALCLQVLSVVSDPDRFFAELSRILKPGACLLLSTNFLYPKWAENDYFRHTDYSLTSLAVRHGFAEITIESFGGWMTTVHCLVMRHVRDSPSRICNATRPVLRFWKLVLYLGWLASLPAWAIAGWAIYISEQTHNSDYSFTVNLLLVARRTGQSGLA